MIKYLENENYEDSIKDGVVLVDFFAEWCGPCKMLGEELNDVRCNVIKIDIDKHGDLGQKMGVMVVPSVFIYKDGNLSEQFTGFKTANEINELLKKITC